MLIIVFKKLQTNRRSSTKTTKNRATKSSNPKHPKHSVSDTCVFDLHLPMEGIRHRNPHPRLLASSFCASSLARGFHVPSCSGFPNGGPLVLSGSSALFWGGFTFKKYRSLGHPDTKIIQNTCFCTALAQSGSPRALRHLTWSCVPPRSAYSFSADCAFINPFMVGWCQINSCSSWSSWVYLGTQSHSAHEALVQCLVPTEWVYHLIDELRTRW